jgi:hypothetical protein
MGQPLVATATLTGFDSRIPVKYKWTWNEDPADENAEVKTETTNSATSSIIPTTTSQYRATCELLYALDDSSVGESSFENSTPAFQPFEWTQGPEIIPGGQQDLYAVNPIGAYIGNSPVTFAYEWMKDSNPFGGGGPTEILYDPGTYTVDVTGSNSVNGQTYSDTEISRNAIIIAPSAPEIAELKIFANRTASGDGFVPSGNELDPNSLTPGSTIYVFAYDDLGQLITDDVLYGNTLDPVTTTILATPSTTAAEVGDTLTVDNIAVTGDPVRGLVTYEWYRGVDLQPSGATYEVKEADEGFAITCVVAVTSGGSSAATPPLSFGTVPFGS